MLAGRSKDWPCGVGVRCVGGLAWQCVSNFQTVGLECSVDRWEALPLGLCPLHRE